MVEKRKLVKDWRDSYENAKIKVQKIENQIKKRFIELCQLHPNAEVGRMLDNSILTADDILKGFDILRINTDGYLLYIEKIENWIAAQHPHQQSEIEFNDNYTKTSMCDDELS
jgi:hypothetical protein